MQLRMKGRPGLFKGERLRALAPGRDGDSPSGWGLRGSLLSHLHFGGPGQDDKRSAIDQPAVGPAGAAPGPDAACGWLFGEVGRERLLDMDRRINPVRSQTMLMLALGLVLCSPWIGLWTLAPMTVAALIFALATRFSPGHAHPERTIFAAWVGSEVIIAASVALSAGPRMAILPWIAIPVVTLPARFPGRALKVGVAIALGLLAAVVYGTNFKAASADPVYFVGPALMIVTIALLSTALMRSDLEHRDRAVIDQLTGMLNRRALHTRSAELSQQSVLSGEPVGLIVADLDHFKAINDSKGHAIGDRVLAEVAKRVRKQLRAFDLVYRYGGEEFVVLLPGADLHESERLAQTLRRAVALTPVCEKLRATLSCGVSASVRGRPFDYERVFAAADSALYEAKRRGRDRVCVATFGNSASGPLITDAG